MFIYHLKLSQFIIKCGFLSHNILIALRGLKFTKFFTKLSTKSFDVGYPKIQYLRI